MTTRCDWCGNLLSTCRCVYKVQDEERYYCSQTCFLQGEERRLRYRAALAGTVHTHWTATLAAVLSVAMLAFIFTGGTRAWATDHNHSPYHGIYEKWQQPIESKSSCCNARFNEKGEEVGDCEHTELFELRNTDNGPQYFAYVPMVKRVLPVPWEKIIREKNPDHTGTRGHVCYTPASGFLCAVPPTGAL